MHRIDAKRLYSVLTLDIMFIGNIIGNIRQSPTHEGIHLSKKDSLAKFISFARISEMTSVAEQNVRHAIESENANPG